ncbi:hypothetical protein [Treponema sp.]|uniref:hypothetical protein n=1 Tax=Treponema sp. TaxID=166 RepID=UPI00298EBF86|nr:hypothetical protein [Treponema sp.]MCQ2241456.1 hypothetical protein [Treponema sp.]
MKAKKFFGNIMILAIFAAAIFYIGWITFRVKPGFCAVMTSKTSGVYEKPIVAGAFTWRWERLLPTNVTLETFDLTPYKTTQAVSGELPGAKLYKDYAAASADFSYNIKFNIAMSISPEQILNLYRENKIKTNEDLQEYYGTKAKIAASLIADAMVKNNSGATVQPSALTESKLLEIIMESKKEFEGIAFSSVEISDCSLPDIEIYNKAKESYESFLAMLNAKLEQYADKNAESYIEMDRTLKQFEKIGDLMKTYPHLQDMFKSGDAAAVINALKTIK